MAALGVLSGWPIAFVTFTAKSPTVTVDFGRCRRRERGHGHNGADVRTSKDFLIMWAPLRWIPGRFHHFMYHSRHAWPSMNADSGKAPRNLRLNNSDVKQVFPGGPSSDEAECVSPAPLCCVVIFRGTKQAPVNACRRRRFRDRLACARLVDHHAGLGASTCPPTRALQQSMHRP